MALASRIRSLDLPLNEKYVLNSAVDLNLESEGPLVSHHLS